LNRPRIFQAEPNIIFSLIPFESDRLFLADSVEKVGFSVGLNLGTTTIGKPTHHIEWFLGSSMTFAAQLVG